jgi:hypothetical protein
LPAQPKRADCREQINATLQKAIPGLRTYPDVAAFSEGDVISVADPAAVDHTRLPGYLRNKPV